MVSKQYNLVRSFYGWVAKTESKLRRMRDKRSPLCFSHPTTVVGAARVSDGICERLEGTEFHEKALYYKKLFADILEHGWRDE